MKIVQQRTEAGKINMEVIGPTVTLKYQNLDEEECDAIIAIVEEEWSKIPNGSVSRFWTLGR